MNIGKPVCFREDRVSAQQVRALRSLEEGTAGPYEQKLALKTILDNFCGTYQQSFVPGAPDQSTFMQGRAFPGQRILHYLKLDPTKLKEIEEEDKTHARTSR